MLLGDVLYGSFGTACLWVQMGLHHHLLHFRAVTADLFNHLRSPSGPCMSFVLWGRVLLREISRTYRTLVPSDQIDRVTRLWGVKVGGLAGFGLKV